MRLYDNAPPRHYDELLTFYPAWYREILEMDAILYALGRQLDGVRAGVIQAVDNGFIKSADEQAIASLEQFLYIPVDNTKELDSRRKLVATYFLGQGHIGEQEIKQIVGNFTGAECKVSFDNGRIEIAVMLGVSDAPLPVGCLLFLLTKIPAHLQLGALTEVTPEVTTSQQYHADTIGIQSGMTFKPPPPQDVASGILYRANNLTLQGGIKLSTAPPQPTLSGGKYRASAITLQEQIVLGAPPPQSAAAGVLYRANNITLQGGIIIGY